MADIEALQRAIDRRKFPDGYPGYSSSEETKEDEKEPQSLNESQSASSGSISVQQDCFMLDAWVAMLQLFRITKH